MKCRSACRCCTADRSGVRTSTCIWTRRRRWRRRPASASARSQQQPTTSTRLLDDRVRRASSSANDPRFVEKLVTRRCSGPCDPPAHAIVLSVDRAAPIQALDSDPPGLPRASASTPATMHPRLRAACARRTRLRRAEASSTDRDRPQHAPCQRQHAGHPTCRRRHRCRGPGCRGTSTRASTTTPRTDILEGPPMRRPTTRARTVRRSAADILLLAQRRRSACSPDSRNAAGVKPPAGSSAPIVDH